MARKKGADDSAPGLPPPLDPGEDIGVSSIRARFKAKFEKSSIPDPLDLDKCDVISSGLLALDFALGVGGYARGRITTFAGPQHAGKTALALVGIASIQEHILWTERRKARIVIIDTEQAHSNSLAQILGCDTDPSSMFVVRPDSAEKAMMMAMAAMGFDSKDDGRTWSRVGESADVVLFDSWAGTSVEGVGLAELARIGAMWFPSLAVYVNRANAFFFMTNHIRFRPGVTFGDPEYQPGGEALKHARSVSIEVHAQAIEKDPTTKDRIAHTVKVYIEKNKLAAAFLSAKLRFINGVGFDKIVDLIEFYERRGISFKETPSGNTYAYGPIRAVGEKNFHKALRDDPETFQQLYNHAKKLISGES